MTAERGCNFTGVGEAELLTNNPSPRQIKFLWARKLYTSESGKSRRPYYCTEILEFINGSYWMKVTAEELLPILMFNDARL